MDQLMSGRSACVLVVEDDDGIREALFDVLTEHGVRTLCARDGAEALDVLTRSDDRPDAILLDVMMPRMDGYAFRERQLADLRLRDIPVVVMTAHADREAIERRLNAPVLRKPFDFENLCERMRAALPQL